jgi:hypothetical protein
MTRLDAINLGYRFKEQGWLAAAGDRLYYRSPDIAPYALVVINPITLQVI